MPNPALNPSQIMTIGANVTAIFVVPKGWIKNRRIRMAHVVPTIVGLVISGLTTLSPWTAPRTDWAGWSQSQSSGVKRAMYHTTNPPRNGAQI
jgi:hypothetical protein